MSKAKRGAKEEEERVTSGKKSTHWVARLSEQGSVVYPVPGLYGNVTVRDPLAVYGEESFYMASLGVVQHSPSASLSQWSIKERPKSLTASLEELKGQLNRATIALQNVALEKANYAVNYLYQAASKHDIKILHCFSKMDNWSDVTSLVIVSVDDYSDDKIEHLFEAVSDVTAQLQSPDFTWNSDITYFSENLDLEKIHSDGFIIKHEQVTQSRTT